MSAVKLDGAGGYSPGGISRQVERKLSSKEWKEISASLAMLEFWQSPTHDSTFGYDGAEWVLEGRKGNRHHVAVRWSPEKGRFREFCLRLVRAAGLLPSKGSDKRDAIY